MADTEGIYLHWMKTFAPQLLDEQVHQEFIQQIQQELKPYYIPVLPGQQEHQEFMKLLKYDISEFYKVYPEDRNYWHCKITDTLMWNNPDHKRETYQIYAKHVLRKNVYTPNRYYFRHKNLKAAKHRRKITHL